MLQQFIKIVHYITPPPRHLGRGNGEKYEIFMVDLGMRLLKNSLA